MTTSLPLSLFLRRAKPLGLIAPLLLLCFALSIVVVNSGQCAKPQARIGVLAYRGLDEANKMWGPTADYLNTTVPDYEFSIVPLNFHAIGPAVAKQEVEFVLANTSIYVELEAHHGITRIATMRNLNQGRAYTSFGGVLFCRADHPGLGKIEDLKGHSLMAVEENSFGGWRIAWRELQRKGINPYQDLRLRFGGTHDRVVYAVRDGEVEAGTVRSDTLERMAQEGLIDLGIFRVINSQVVDDFPFLLSSPLYPEWPMAKTKSTKEELAQKMAIALLSLPSSSPAAKAGKIAGWATPLDYQPVHELMRELRLPPYHDYGKITLSEVANKYKYLILAGMGAILLLSGMLIRVVSLNQSLMLSKQRLEKTFTQLQKETRERQQVEDALRRAYQFSKTVLDSMNDSISIINVNNWTIAGANNKFLQEYGLAEEKAAIGRKCHELTHNNSHVCTPPNDPCPLEMTMASGRHKSVEHRHHDLDGKIRYVEVATSPIRNDQGEVVQVVHVARDITGRKNLETSLAASREEIGRSNGLLQAGLDGIFALIQEVIVRKDFRVRFQKEEEKNLAAGEDSASPIEQIGEHFNQMMDILEHQHQELESVYSTVQTTQSHLLQQEKMASIGQLAAGVAHEINNPMGFIMSNLGTLRKYTERFFEFIAAQGEAIAKLAAADTATIARLHQLEKSLKIAYIKDDIINLLTESLEGTERVRNIVQNLKSFSRLDESAVKMADINAGLESTINIVWNELKYKATVIRDYGELPLTACNLGQLNQVFMNLLVNAAQAIEKQGEIRVATWMSEGRIQIAIADTGGGIPADKMSRIFEPFYTTKAVGQGTGLGLSIAYDLVKKHDGEIVATSRMGQGTTFTVSIPVKED